METDRVLVGGREVGGRGESDEEEARLIGAGESDELSTSHLWGVPLTWLPFCLIVFSFFFAVGTWAAMEQWESGDVWSKNDYDATTTKSFDDLYNGDAVPDFSSQEWSKVESQSTYQKEEEEENAAPSACTTAKHFIFTNAFVLINTFPGSGSTAVRRAIEDGTRIYTGSQFDNVHLFRDGFRGELLDSFAENKCPVSVIQSHYPYFRMRDSKTSAVVLLMRNPFAALHADFVQTHFNPEAGGASNKTQQEDMFTARFEEKVQKWKQFSSFWLGDEDWRQQHVINKEDGVVSLTLSRVISNNRPVPVLVLFYEDFERDWAVAAKRLFGFLKDQLKGDMAISVDDAVVCSMLDRKPAPIASTINLYDALSPLHTSKACEEWKDMWFEEVWGMCSSPTTPQLP
ncbi:hypothetical protein BASA81_013850 [Batrachochytrium salamandrivorans]|nr:hypothetical protein BASA81_013850 [Batrachochytrium salamandrivorans]